MSLSYNLPGGNPGTHLLGDLNQSNFNRVDAWFQIRYESNGGSSQSGGIAKRRYEESEVFGLYAPDDSSSGSVVAPLSEALKIYSEFSIASNKLDTSNSIQKGQMFRNYAFNYESAYQSHITDANDDLHTEAMDITDIGGFTVGTLEGELQSAADTLVDNYVTNATLNPWVGASVAGETIDSLDVQVATNQGGDYLLASQRTAYQLGTGSFLSSLLIAQSGNDTLDASASTVNNALVGGTGDDTILGGTGDDYIVAGTGNDLITLIGGDDTLVLGDANNPSDGGHDTVDASQDSGHVTYYVGAGTHETIVMDPSAGAQAPTINVVSQGSGGGTSVNTLNITAQWIAPGEWYDDTTGALLIQQPDTSTGQVDPSASTKNIEVLFGLYGSSYSQTNASMAGRLGRMTEGLEPRDMMYSRFGSMYTRYGEMYNGLEPLSYRPQAMASRLSLAQLQAIAAGTASGSTASSVVELTLNGFTGSSDYGITLGDEPAGPTLPGSDNLSSLDNQGLVGNTDIPGNANYVYRNDINGATIASIYGADSSGSPYGNEINGDGNASYIYAGNGDNLVLLGDFDYQATVPTDTALSATIQGGSGDQGLVGVGNGTETIIGGAVGSDTTADTYIDGGGATGLLEGGGQNSVIFGGTGADTIIASTADGTGPAGFNPTTFAMAGVSFWGMPTAPNSTKTGTRTKKVHYPRSPRRKRHRMTYRSTYRSSSPTAPLDRLSVCWVLRTIQAWPMVRRRCQAAS